MPADTAEARAKNTNTFIDGPLVVNENDVTDLSDVALDFDEEDDGIQISLHGDSADVLMSPSPATSTTAVINQTLNLPSVSSTTPTSDSPTVSTENVPEESLSSDDDGVSAKKINILDDSPIPVHVDSRVFISEQEPEEVKNAAAGDTENADELDGAASPSWAEFAGPSSSFTGSSDPVSTPAVAEKSVDIPEEENDEDWGDFSDFASAAPPEEPKTPDTPLQYPSHLTVFCAYFFVRYPSKISIKELYLLRSNLQQVFMRRLSVPFRKRSSRWKTLRPYRWISTASLS